MSAQTLYRICPLCEAGCGLEVTTRGREILSVRGNDSDVFSRGYICPKGVSIKELHDDPDRLRTPLIKRNGTHEPASWEEAWRLINVRLPAVIETSGRDAVATYLGNPSAHSIECTAGIGPLLGAIGSKNRYSASSVDQLPHQYICGVMYGSWASVPIPDIDRCDYLVIAGGNPLVSNGSLWTVPDFPARVKALQTRGGRLVVIDPRRTETARIADQHLFIKPATDVFFLLGVLHTLFDEGLARPARLEPLLEGYARLPELVAPFSPDRVSGRCGVPAAAIHDVARNLAGREQAALYGRIGTCVQQYGSETNWLIQVINIVAGNLDTAGGMMFARPPAYARNDQGPPGRGRGVMTDRYRTRVRGLPETMTELPVAALAEEIETPGEGQIKALVMVAGNPVCSTPNSARLEAALARLDFMVSLDIYLNETSRHADVILPGTSPFEKPHYDAFLAAFAVRNVARYSPALFPPAAGQWSEFDSLMQLAHIAAGRGVASRERLNTLQHEALDGMIGKAVTDPDSPIFERDPAAIRQQMHSTGGAELTLEFLLRTGPYGDGFGANPAGLTLARLAAAPDGIDLGPLEPRLPAALRTPSGKIELIEERVVARIAALAAATPSFSNGLLLIGRRNIQSNNSWMHNIPNLARGPLRCTLLVNPVDAERLGLVDGTEAAIRSRVGEVRAPVEITDEVMAGVVSLPHGWGHTPDKCRQGVAVLRPGANSNVLADETAVDVLTGTAVLNGIPVEVRAA